VVVYSAGACVLGAALVVIRVFSRPHAGGHFIWISVGLAGLVTTLYLWATSITNAFDNSRDAPWPVGFTLDARVRLDNPEDERR
jgi:hypothetical protein